jgi:Flp pilus assembly protein TadG
MLAWGKALSHPTTAVRKFTGRFARDERGAAIILVAFVVVVLCLVAGVAIDSARGYLLKSRLSGALDAAGLAGARVMHLTPAERDADIYAYFNANFPPGFMDATTQPLTITTDTDNKVLTLTASASVGTTLMRVIGHDSMAVAARTVIRRETRGLEVVMVLDNTGSMCDSGCAKLDALKVAATDLVDILYGSEETIPNLWVGLAPFVHSVNVGNQHAAWLLQAPRDAGGNPPPHAHVNTTACNANPTSTTACQQAPLDAYHPSYYAGAPRYGPANIRWKGCVEARVRPDNGSDLNDDPPSVRPFRPHFFPETRTRTSTRRGASTVDNPWWPRANEVASNGNGPNIGCGAPIQGLTDSKTTILTAINSMESWFYGGTSIKHGMAWGWRMLSPRWRGLWGGDPTLPKDYTEPLMDKAIIVLTDGVHVFWNRKNFPGPDPGDYTSHGRVTWGRLHDAGGTPITSRTAAQAEMDRRLTLICNAVKATGINVYTIMLQVNSPSLQNLFRNCASKPEYFFEAPDSTDRSQIFRAIANDLAQLRIAE